MAPDLDRLLADARRAGPRRFARWNADLFDALAAGPVRALAESLPDATVLAGYLRVLQEGIGTGVVRQAGGAWSNFLEQCLIDLVPVQLPLLAAAEHMPLLVKLWNLGEGLLREPDWVDRYVAACATSLNLNELEPFLETVLEPVLVPAAASAWAGPFHVTVLDLRPLHDEFLPGPMHLAAPAVLCVKDRRRPDLQAGVFLRPKRKSHLLGLTQGLGEYREGDPGPKVTPADQHLHIGAHTVPLPTLRQTHAVFQARAGFVVASAVDSQRLWVVESE